MNDPISDLLTRIRNANRALLPTVELPHSKIKESIVGILKREGYIADFAVEGKLPKTIKVKLKYQGKKSIIEGLRRVSTPGLRRMRSSTSVWSAICGIHFGETNAVASTAGRPASARRSISSIFTAVGTSRGSFCSPSRGPTSTMRIVVIRA